MTQPAKRFYVDVADTLLPQGLFEIFLVELRVMARFGYGSDIDDHSNLVCSKQFYKFIDGSCGMSDREDGGFFHD